VKRARAEGEVHGADAALARAVAAGERRAFDAFFDEYFDRIYSYLARRCGADAADQWVGPALERILVSLERYGAREPLAVWVLCECKAVASLIAGVSPDTAPPEGARATPHPGFASDAGLGHP
jgi:hypothetical protein